MNGRRSPSRFLGRPWIRAAALAALPLSVAWAACVDLDAVEHNVCGNRVVEPERGEDCDEESDQCGKPGSANECRFICSSNSDCDAKKGYRCGVDGVCRRPKGDFEKLTTFTTSTALDLQLGDTNGDGCDEVVNEHVIGTTVTSFDSAFPGACAASRQDFRERPSDERFASPFLVDLTDDQARYPGKELVLAGRGLLGGGGQIFTAKPEKALVPFLFPSFEINAPGAKMVKVRLGQGTADSIFLFLGQQLVLDPNITAPQQGDSASACESMDAGSSGGQGGAPPLPTCEGDGGLPPLDGGMMMMGDGGLPPPDGGMMMGDGGLPPPADGGDGGLPPPDGGMMMGDGGLPPPADGGDGGLPPPPDGGPPPPDGGPPPPDGGPPPPLPPDHYANRVDLAIISAPEVPGANPIKMLPLAPELDLKRDLNTISAIKAADLDGDGCDEVLFTVAATKEIHVYKLCHAGSDEIVPQEIATITLDSGLLRQYNASIALFDENGDGALDVLVADDGVSSQLHIAYGAGDGTFFSTVDPVTKLPAGDVNETSVYELPDALMQCRATKLDTVLVVGEFAKREGECKASQEVIAVPCAFPAKFQSSVCSDTPRACEVVSADIDNSGLDDVIISSPGLPEIVVERSSEKLGFAISTISTNCPAKGLAVGDLDHDDVPDLAFFDEVTGPENKPATVLKVAYGAAFASPNPPVLGGFYPDATGMVNGQMVKTPTGQLFMSASRGMDGGEAWTFGALVDGRPDRQTFAPFYFPVFPPIDGAPKVTDTTARVLAATVGKLGPSGEVSVAVLTESSWPIVQKYLWVLRPNIAEKETQGAAAPIDVRCDHCVLAPIPNQAASRDDLLIFESPDPAAPTSPHDVSFYDLQPLYDAPGVKLSGISALTTTRRFASIDDASPKKYTQRPLVDDLDGDGHVDVALLDTDGKLVVLWGQGGNQFNESEPTCGKDEKGKDKACPLRLSIARLQMPLVEEKVEEKTEPLYVIVAPGHIGFYTWSEQKLVDSNAISANELAQSIPGIDADYVAVASGDVDGDGVLDLVLMTSSSNVDVYRGIPVNP